MFENNVVFSAQTGACPGGPNGMHMTVPVDAGWLRPLIETQSEKPRSAIANYLQQVDAGPSLAVTVAYSGFQQACLEEGTTAFTGITRAFENLKRVGAWHDPETEAQLEIVWVQNEGDEALQTPAATYATGMENIYASIVDAAGNPTVTPRIWMVQAQAWTDPTNGTTHTTPTAAIGQYIFARAHPEYAKILGPTYLYSTAVGSTVHRNTLGACESAATWGAAIHAGDSFQPVWPVMGQSPTLSGTTITLHLYAPTCPLQFLTSKITGVSTANRGLEYACSSSPPSISSVTFGSCANNDQTVTIELDGNPDATCESDDILRGVYTGTNGAAEGPSTGPRSPICDSTATTYQCGATSVTLSNCLVTFEESVSGG